MPAPGAQPNNGIDRSAKQSAYALSLRHELVAKKKELAENAGKTESNKGKLGLDQQVDWLDTVLDTVHVAFTAVATMPDEIYTANSGLKAMRQDCKDTATKKELSKASPNWAIQEYVAETLNLAGKYLKFAAELVKTGMSLEDAWQEVKTISAEAKVAAKNQILAQLVNAAEAIASSQVFSAGRKLKGLLKTYNKIVAELLKPAKNLGLQEEISPEGMAEKALAAFNKIKNQLCEEKTRVLAEKEYLEMDADMVRV